MIKFERRRRVVEFVQVMNETSTILVVRKNLTTVNTSIEYVKKIHFLIIPRM